MSSIRVFDHDQSKSRRGTRSRDTPLCLEASCNVAGSSVQWPPHFHPIKRNQHTTSNLITKPPIKFKLILINPFSVMNRNSWCYDCLRLSNVYEFRKIAHYAARLCQWTKTFRITWWPLWTNLYDQYGFCRRTRKLYLY